MMLMLTARLADPSVRQVEPGLPKGLPLISHDPFGTLYEVCVSGVQNVMKVRASAWLFRCCPRSKNGVIRGSGVDFITQSHSTEQRLEYSFFRRPTKSCILRACVPVALLSSSRTAWCVDAFAQEPCIMYIKIALLAFRDLNVERLLQAVTSTNRTVKVG
jgi:hypothetical protein